MAVAHLRHNSMYVCAQNMKIKEYRKVNGKIVKTIKYGYGCVTLAIKQYKELLLQLLNHWFSNKY